MLFPNLKNMKVITFKKGKGNYYLTKKEFMKRMENDPELPKGVGASKGQVASID